MNFWTPCTTNLRKRHKALATWWNSVRESQHNVVPDLMPLLKRFLRVRKQICSIISGPCVGPLESQPRYAQYNIQAAFSRHWTRPALQDPRTPLAGIPGSSEASTAEDTLCFAFVLKIFASNRCLSELKCVPYVMS